MAVNNPRFPHTCRIVRKETRHPLVDEEDYTPLEDESLATSASYDGDFNNDFSADFGPDNTIQVIYEGKCRCYEKHTTSDRGDVITSFRGLALPMTQDDWKRLGIIPREGDEVAVDRGAFKEYGHVVDKNPANFHGTHIIWRYGRN